MSTTQTAPIDAASNLQERARDVILNHRRLFNQLERLEVVAVGETLIVTGFLPTFYLKQLLQTALMELGGVSIENRVKVRSA